MADCSKTENYMIEKARMTKSVVNGVCHIRCTDCPLSRFNNKVTCILAVIGVGISLLREVKSDESLSV